MQRKAVNPDTVFNTLQYGFSQAIVVQGGHRVYLSGQVGVDAEEQTVEGGFAAQAEAAVDNIEAILADVEGTLSHVVVLRIYIVESVKDEQGLIVDVLRERFPNDPPATSWIVVHGLSEPEWLIEIEAEAVLPVLNEKRDGTNRVAG